MSQDTTAPGSTGGPVVEDVTVERTESVAVVQPGLLARLGAEVFGTFFLVLAIVGVAMWARFFNGNLVLSVAFAGGVALLAAIAAVGHVSGGHFNPAVTLGAAIGGRTAWRDVLPYWLAQVVGAVLAGLVLLATIPRSSLDVLQQNTLIDEATTAALFRTTANGFDAHSPLTSTFAAAGVEVTVGLAAALLVEVVATAVLVGVILGVTDNRTRSTIAPIAIGLALAALLLVAAPFTNASLNPARSTVSAVFGGDWALSQLWLFWVAPLLGAAIAGLFYRAFAFAPAQDDLLGEDQLVTTEELDVEEPVAVSTGPTAGAAATTGATATATADDAATTVPTSSEPVTAAPAAVAPEPVESSEVVEAPRTDRPAAEGDDDTQAPKV
ncbi:aquaporin [Cellulosimicrobium sp. Marseille-Q4280]|uniref:aquaporin n=1 Tax=Cellulosimicrobium sp. Marseille-Q4280 TaxID=2937992 RepID=UPI00203EC611|nr:aquaporin [Cellulosimicrobium sp. Marseille-Q4280]